MATFRFRRLYARNCPHRGLGVAVAGCVNPVACRCNHDRMAGWADSAVARLVLSKTGLIRNLLSGR